MQRNVKGEERKEKNKEHDVVKGRTAKNIFIYISYFCRFGLHSFITNNK